MKHISLFLVTALISTVAFADDAKKTISAGETASLTSCGGRVTTRLNSEEQLVLNFSGVKDCSNFDITKSDNGTVGDYSSKKLSNSVPRSGSFTIPKKLMGDKSVTITIKSNSGKHADTVKVVLETEHYAFHAISLGQGTVLSVCGGYLDTNNGGNDTQLNVVFKNVKDCSKFDILSASGDVVSAYPTKTIPGTPGNYSGSFSIPKKYIDYGWHSVTIVAKSISGKHEERVNISYVGLPRW